MQGKTYCHDCNTVALSAAGDISRDFVEKHQGHKITAWFVESEGGKAYAKRRGVPEAHINPDQVNAAGMSNS